MHPTTDEPGGHLTNDPRNISKWARVYAQNRSLAVVVSMIVVLVLSATIGGSSFLAAVAYRWGNMLLFWVSIAVLVPALGAVIYVSVPRWGGKLLDRVVQRLYATEGNVAFAPPGERAKFWGPILAACVVICVVASVMLDFAYDIPVKYTQPISALYLVPFLIGMWLLMRPMAGYLAVLWPVLYATHAILIVAGAPIFFSGPWQVLNILLPMAGYGMLAGLLSHAYSRFALHRLRSLAKTDGVADHRQHEATGQ